MGAWLVGLISGEPWRFETRAATEVDPLGKTTTFAHDVVDNLTWRTDRLENPVSAHGKTWCQFMFQPFDLGRVIGEWRETQLGRLPRPTLDSRSESPLDPGSLAEYASD